MKRKLLTMLALMTGLIMLASCAGGSSALKPVAKVNDVEISGQEFQLWMESSLTDMFGNMMDTTGDLSDEDKQFLEETRDDIIDTLIDLEVQLQKASEDGLDQLTDEEKANAESYAKQQMDSWYDNFTAEVAEEGELTGATAAEEAKKRYDDYINEKGYTLEYVTEVYTNNIILDKLAEKYYAQLEPTDEQLKAKYDERVASDKETYTADPDSYAEAVIYSTPLYHPSGYRRVSHILFAMSDTESEEVYGLQEAGDEAGATAKQDEYMANCKTEADEIYAQLAEDGSKFTELMQEHSDDVYNGELSSPEGYTLNANTTYLDAAFVEGAMALSKVGDISEPIKTDFGYHILKYEEDVQEHTTPYDDIDETLLEEFKQEIVYEEYEKLVDEWEKGMKVERYPDNAVYPTPAPTPSPDPNATTESPVTTAPEESPVDPETTAPVTSAPVTTAPDTTAPVSTAPETSAPVDTPAESTSTSPSAT